MASRHREKRGRVGEGETRRFLRYTYLIPSRFLPLSPSPPLPFSLSPVLAALAPQVLPSLPDRRGRRFRPVAAAAHPKKMLGQHRRTRTTACRARFIGLGKIITSGIFSRRFNSTRSPIAAHSNVTRISRKCPSNSS